MQDHILNTFAISQFHGKATKYLGNDLNGLESNHAEITANMVLFAALERLPQRPTQVEPQKKGLQI